MDTQTLQPVKNTKIDDALTPSEYAAYEARKGQPFQLDEFTFKSHPNLTPGEQVDLWRDDSAILEELIHAVLLHAPRFAEWISDGVPAETLEAARQAERESKIDKSEASQAATTIPQPPEPGYRNVQQPNRPFPDPKEWSLDPKDVGL